MKHFNIVILMYFQSIWILNVKTNSWNFQIFQFHFAPMLNSSSSLNQTGWGVL